MIEKDRPLVHQVLRARYASATSRPRVSAEGVPDAGIPWIAIFGTAVAVLLIPETTGAVSFDCSKASNEAERLVCFDSDLSDLDDRMSSCYARIQRDHASSRELVLDQRAWLGRRDRCGTMGCVSEAYESRLAELSCVPATDNKERVSRSKNRMVVQLRSQNGVLTVPVSINDRITLDFVIDSGAADVAIPADVAMTLFRTGSLTANDFLGKRTYRLADGSTIPSDTFRIRSLRVGSMVLDDVTGSIAPVEGPLLLGQSFLSRFRSWSIDNESGVLVLE